MSGFLFVISCVLAGLAGLAGFSAAEREWGSFWIFAGASVVVAFIRAAWLYHDALQSKE